jgi:hypothetical protein
VFKLNLGDDQSFIVALEYVDLPLQVAAGNLIANLLDDSA